MKMYGRCQEYSNVDVWKRLKKYRDGLKKLRFGEKSEWDF